jgi:hypothetical protein
MKRLFGDRADSAKLIPADPLVLQRLAPTAQLRQRLEALRGGLDGPAIQPQRVWSAHAQIERLERDLVDAEERDRIQAGRPEGCWCLGAGGRGMRMLYETLAEVFEEPCNCAEGQARRALDEQARATPFVRAAQPRQPTCRLPGAQLALRSSKLEPDGYYDT